MGDCTLDELSQLDTYSLTTLCGEYPEAIANLIGNSSFDYYYNDEMEVNDNE